MISKNKISRRLTTDVLIIGAADFAGNDLAVLVLGDDAVGFEFGILDLFGAVAVTDFHRFDFEV